MRAADRVGPASRLNLRRLSVLFSSLLAACAAPARDEHQAERAPGPPPSVEAQAADPALDEEVRRFDALRSWKGLSRESSASEAEQLLRDYTAQTARLSNAELRRVLTAVAARAPREDLDIRLATEGKALVWIRTAFRIPALVPEGTVERWDGFFADRRKPPGSYDAAWPLEVSEDGAIRLTGHFEGYNGPPYDYLGEFDEFVRVFPRR